MSSFLFLIHLVACWIWPFVFIFNLINVIHIDRTEEVKSSGSSRTASIIWTGISLAMMTAVPYYFIFFSKII